MFLGDVLQHNEDDPLYPELVDRFYHEWVLNCVKCFFFVYQDDRWFLSFIILTWCLDRKSVV